VFAFGRFRLGKSNVFFMSMHCSLQIRKGMNITTVENLSRRKKTRIPQRPCPGSV
jgi:hypothetical protein